jgi:hypothetical protein
VGKPKGKWSHGKPRHGREVNYTDPNTSWEGILWITVAYNPDKIWTLLNKVMNFTVSFRAL